MEGREEGDPGYDDWFDEPEPPKERASGARGGVYDDTEEVWVLPEDEGGEPPHRREIVIAGRTLTTTQVAIIAVSLLALILAILAAAGVFSSKTATPPVTTPTTPVTVTVSTPTTTAATPTVQAPQQTLTPGETGPQVKTLQQALTSLGYSPGKADGSYGPSTQAAVEEFQAAKGLTQDGVVGPQTLAALQQALAG